MTPPNPKTNVTTPSPTTTTTSTTTPPFCIQFQDVISASKRIQTIAHRTPIHTCTYLNNQSSHNIYFKVEAFQRTGSFKFRGALNAILSHIESISSSEEDDDDDDDEHTPKNINIITHSSGNHAAAVALASKLASSQQHQQQQVNATIVMPRNAPSIKQNAVIGYGGTIVQVENTNEAREDMAETLVKQSVGSSSSSSSLFVHPSEDPNVIAGQGTVCLEMVEQVQTEMGVELDVVVIPVGGGGLASGNAIALRGLLGDTVKIILAEPKELDDAKRSFHANRLLTHSKTNTLNSIADGLKTTLGPNTWPIIQHLVDDIITVSEDEILKATQLVWEKMKICIEPSAGVGVAVVLSDEFQKKFGENKRRKNVGVVLCGGNVDVVTLAELMKRL